MLHDERADEADVSAYLRRWALMTPEVAAHVIRFCKEPTSRTYILTYHAGLGLCGSFVAGDHDRFRRLLTEQLRVRDLAVPAA
jgi:hypothetical protein